MPEGNSVDNSLIQLSRYARVARNSQMLLVMEPPEESTLEVTEARDSIASEAYAYLEDVLSGVESPYFIAYTNQDRRYIEAVAAEKIRQAVYDHRGLFYLTEHTIETPDSRMAQAASFAYLATGYMQQVKAPFFQAPALRAALSAPRNLAEFVRTVTLVKDTTQLAAEKEDFRRVVQKQDWRVSFAFWEANRWLAGTMSGMS